MIPRNFSSALLYVALVFSAALLLDVSPTHAQAQSLAASDAATQSAQAKLAAATAAQNAGKKKYPVTREDIVVAMPVDQAHLTVAHASRVWRKVLTLSTSTSLSDCADNCTIGKAGVAGPCLIFTKSLVFKALFQFNNHTTVSTKYTAVPMFNNASLYSIHSPHRL